MKTAPCPQHTACSHVPSTHRDCSGCSAIPGVGAERNQGQEPQVQPRAEPCRPAGNPILPIKEISGKESCLTEAVLQLLGLCFGVRGFAGQEGAGKGAQGTAEGPGTFMVKPDAPEASPHIPQHPRRATRARMLPGGSCQPRGGTGKESAHTNPHPGQAHWSSCRRRNHSMINQG